MDRASEKFRLPIWFGDRRKDVFNARQWIANVEKTKSLAHWNNEVTMVYVVNALRGQALGWFLQLVQCESLDKLVLMCCLGSGHKPDLANDSSPSIGIHALFLVF